MSWDDILKEIANKKAACYLGRKKPNNVANNVCEPKIKRVLKVYSLGEKYGATYFTKREAECMLCMLKGKTINSIADYLRLSPRTVEFYIKNMKAKLRCRTKFQLIEMVYNSDFMKSVDFH